MGSNVLGMCLRAGRGLVLFYLSLHELWKRLQGDGSLEDNVPGQKAGHIC